MKRIDARIPDILSSDFLQFVEKNYGTKKGKISLAITDSISYFIHKKPYHEYLKDKHKESRNLL